MSLARLAEQIAAGQLSPSEAVNSYLARIRALEPSTNCFISLRAEEALSEARALERRPRRGMLWGVPVAVLDVIDVEGVQTTGASSVLADAPVAPRDSVVVQRLTRAGAIVLGKLNGHEFGYGAMTISPRFGRTPNPWSFERSSGGAGGAGAAVALDLAAGALATDTGGSIRISAAYCGVTGLRPTTGRVSTVGVLPVSWSFDTVGPIARSAEDCALLFRVISSGHQGPGAEQLRTANGRRRRQNSLRGLRLAVVETLVEQTDASVAAVMARVADELRNLGATVESVELRLLSATPTIQQALVLPELAASHRGWLRERFNDYSPDFRSRPLMGLFMPATAYITGLRARYLILEELNRVLDRFDLLMAPAAPSVAPAVGNVVAHTDGEAIRHAKRLLPFNSPWSVVASPAVSLPCGFIDGLPVGVVIAGKRFDDTTALRVGRIYQAATHWHEHRPPAAEPI